VTSRLQGRADLAIAFISFLYGATFMVVKQALGDVSSILFLALRFTLGAALMMAMFRGRWWPARPPDWRAGLTVGAVLFGGYVLQTWGLQQTTASKAGFVTGFYIPLVPLLAALVYRKAPRSMEVAGVGVATAGLVLLTLPEDFLSFNRGDLLVFASTFAWAAHILFLARLGAHTPFATLSVLQVASAAACAWLTFWWVEPVKLIWSWPVAVALGIGAVFATAIAISLQSWAQQHTTATRTALIFALEPVFAWITAYAWAGETLTGRAWAGAVLVLAGVLLVELKPGPRPEHP
jgi:drug/metabolite transporter (DMT)-like permease